MDAEQRSNAPASLMRRLGGWARGDKYMAGAYPPEWQARAAGDGPVVPVDQPTVPAIAMDGRTPATAVDGGAVPAPAAVASGG
jgi:hypothetical protein